MNNATHTAGPYICRQDTCGDVYVKTADGRQICLLENWDRDQDGVRFATGKLLAAAPDLLAMLETCADWLSRSARIDDREIACDARAAIAKAKGEA